MESKKIEKKVENKSPLKVESKKLSKEELKATIGGGAVWWYGYEHPDAVNAWYSG